MNSKTTRGVGVPLALGRPVFVATEIRRAVNRQAGAPGLTSTLLLTVAVGAGCTASIAGFIGGLTGPDAIEMDSDAAARFAHVTRLLIVASVMVLLIACASVAGMLLSKASARLAETAVKIALGASRRRLALEGLADSVVLSLTGGALGALCAWWTMHLVPLLFFIEDADQLAFAPNRGWLIATACLWIAAIAICAMAPVLVAPHRDPAQVLKRAAPGNSHVSRRLRAGLVSGQIALCLMLVVVAGVIRDDLRATLRTARGTLVGTLLVAKVNVSSQQQLRQTQDQVEKTVGVTGVAWVRTLPGARAASQTFAVEPPPDVSREIHLDVTTLRPADYPPEELRAISGRLFGGSDRPDACLVAVLNDTAANRYFDGDALGRSLQQATGPRVRIVGVVGSPPTERRRRPMIYFYENQTPTGSDVMRRDEVFYTSASGVARQRTTLDVNAASPRYFEMFGDPPIAGRALTAVDRPGSCREGVVTQSAALRVFEGSAIGGALIDAKGERVDIVGVVRAEALGAGQQTPSPMVFVPLDEQVPQVLALAVRGNDMSPTLSIAVESKLRAVSNDAVVSTVTTLESLLSRTALASERIATMLVGVCAVSALVLSFGGVHALMSDLVVRRRRELALRMALGATSWQVLGAIAREGLRLATLGGAVGVVMSIVSTPLIAAVVIRPRFPTTGAFATGAAAVAVLVIISSALPGWRAVRVDPRVVMRDE